MVGNYMLFYCGKEKSERVQAGVGLLIAKKFLNNIKGTEYIDERIMTLTLMLENNTTHTHIISIYAPQTGRPKHERDAFYHTLQSLLDTLPKNDHKIIMGDFNGHIGDAVIPGIKQKFNDPAINDSGEDMIDFCTLNELRINNTYFDHKPQHKYTWTDKRGRKSTIDFILTSRHICTSKTDK
jgi:exonuclease III